MDLGERIAFLRRRRRMSQQELAEILGVTRQTINTWEHGKVTVSKTRKHELAMALGIIGDVFEEDFDFDPEQMNLERIFPKNQGGPDIYTLVPSQQARNKKFDVDFYRVITILQSMLQNLENLEDLTPLEMIGTLLELARTKVENRKAMIEERQSSEEASSSCSETGD